MVADVIKGVESITLFSESARKLAEFYREKVGLTLTMEAEIGGKGEELYCFEMTEGSTLYIVDHSKVKGRNKEPDRIILNLEVDKIEDSVKRLDNLGVRKVQDTYHVEGYGLIATFEDADGNYFQLVQTGGS